MSLLNYIIRRLLLMILVLFGVSLLVFTVLMLNPPGMRVAAYVTNEKVPVSQIENMITRYGLRDPAPVQYFRWMGHVLSLDFGYSATADAPGLVGVRDYFPVPLGLG